MFKPPKDDAKYEWTRHAWAKMQQYGIGEGRIKRIIRFPKRIEEGIAPQTVAVMQPGGSSKYHEIWVMYKLTDNGKQSASRRTNNNGEQGKEKKQSIANFFLSDKKMKIITAWRYPGVSPKRNPIPSDILDEIQGLL